MATPVVGGKVTYVKAPGEEYEARVASLSTPAKPPLRGNVPGLRLMVKFGAIEMAVDGVKAEGDDRGANEGFYR